MRRKYYGYISHYQKFSNHLHLFLEDKELIEQYDKQPQN